MFGVRGAPGNTVNHRTSYWVPKHSPRVFVERSTWCPASATTAPSAAAGRFHDVHRVVTNLAVLDFATPDHRCGSRRCTPASPSTRYSAETGFALVAEDVADDPRADRRGAEAAARGARPEGLSREGGAGVTRLRTALTELVGVEHPIVQTGMGWVAGPRLVAGTAEAGGLGILAVGDDDLRRAGRAPSTRPRRAPTQPFGVNLRADAADASRPGRPADRRAACGSRRSRSRPSRSSSSGSRPPASVVIPSIGAAKHARKVADWGADAVIVQGGEGGGHTGGGRDHAAAAVRARRRRHPGDRGRRLLRRSRAGRRAGLRRGRRRDGHPLPAHPRRARSPTR